MYRANIGTFAQIMKRNQMEDTKHIKISEYNYPLPDERIAKFPLAVRDQSKLLVYRHGEVSEDTFTALPEYLEQGELMIFNNTKVWSRYSRTIMYCPSSKRKNAAGSA